MICQICGNEYIALFAHVRLAHNISARDYKFKFNLPLTKALADDSWVEKMRAIGNERKETAKGSEVIERLKGYAADQCEKFRAGEIKQSAIPRDQWPKCSKEKIDKIGGESRRMHALEKLEIVKAEWAAGVPVRELSVGSGTAQRWVEQGILPKRKKTISKEHLAALQRGARERRKK